MSSKNPWETSDDEDPWKKSNSTGTFPFDVIDNLKKRMNKMGGGGNQKIPSRNFLIYVLGGLAILYLASGFYQVQHNERGVVLRFGRWVRTVGPGLQYILPSPLESVILQQVTNVNQIDVGSFFNSQQEESLMLTGDSNLANISFSVLWKIKEDGVEDYLFNAKSPDVTVRAVAESVMREIVGQALFSFVQTEGRAEIQQKVLENLQALMNEYKMGIEILRVELQRVEPPASVIDSFRDVERAQAEQQSEKNKAEAYDRDTRARTRGIVAETINSGEAQKRAIVEIARGEVARFLSAYSQYQLAPDVVSKRLYIDTMRDIYKSVNKIIIDDKVNAVSYLPLTEIAKNKIPSQKETAQ
ncbi:MAG: FtsH protease activity modulator HflK [Holosporaceae bacterium]|jgi:membrane protease subunit HflK|nr:FtsH protease activity modulator HflK [Holosporaceae bacterium]